MIEMPLNRTAATSAPSPVGGDVSADSPEGAFAEMLGRNLGERIVARRGQQHQEAQQDAAQGGSGNGAEFYQGAIVTQWTPAAVAANEPVGLPIGSAAVAPPATDTITAEPAKPIPTLMASDHNAMPAGMLATDSPAEAPPNPVEVSQPAQNTPPQPVEAAAPSLQLAHPVGPLPAGRQYAAPIAPHEPATSASAAAPPAPPNPIAGTDAASFVVADPGSAAAPPEPQAAATIPGAPAGQPSPTIAPAEASVAAAPVTSREVRLSPGPAYLDVSSPAAPVAERAAEPAVMPDQTVAEVGGSQQGSAPSSPPSPARTQASVPASLINRVLEAIEHQQSQPPPRMVVVEMPELEGLRLMVALRNDGKVHVAPLAASAPPQIAEPFVQAVGEALAAEGFDLAKSFDDTAEGRRERGDHNNPEEVPQRRRHSRRPSRPTGLRL